MHRVPACATHRQYTMAALRPYPLARWLPRASRQMSSVGRKSVAEYLDWKPESVAADSTVNGYVRSVRTMKSGIFVHVGDGSSRTPLQALVPRGMDGGSELRVGAAVSLRGSWTPSQHASQSHELRVDKVDVLGHSDAATYPIQKKYQTPEYLRSIPHLRSRIPLNTALLRLRSDAVASLNQFFASRNFVQTHTPVITSSDCEGAGEVFTVSAGPTETSSSNPTGSKAKASDMFFRTPKYLTVSAQLHLEALAQSLGNVWTLSPTFRAERSDTSRHMSEFYMLEAEMPFVEDMGDVLNLVEDMLRHLTTSLYHSRAASDLLLRTQTPKSGPGSGSTSRTAGDDMVPVEEVERRWAGMMQSTASRWPRITYTDAIKILQAEAHRFEFKPAWGDGLQSEHEKYLASALGATDDPNIYQPVFVTHYPRDIKAFYMRSSLTGSQTAGPEHDRPIGLRQTGVTVDCFDLLVPDLCEIAGGSMREHRLAELEEEMQRRGMVTRPVKGDRRASPQSSPSGLDWYLDLRRWGSCPHGGFGLGFDRLLSYLSGVQNVRDVVAFPRWHGRCDC